MESPSAGRGQVVAARQEAGVGETKLRRANDKACCRDWCCCCLKTTRLKGDIAVRSRKESTIDCQSRSKIEIRTLRLSSLGPNGDDLLTSRLPSSLFRRAGRYDGEERRRRKKKLRKKDPTSPDHGLTDVQRGAYRSGDWG
eukprot:scaffold1211_cov169-Amphora_coffeaeformis.AAC.9